MRRGRPSAFPDHVKLALNLDLRRTLAERLSVRAIRQRKNLEAIVIEMLDASFHSIEDLRTAVLEFIAAWNRDRAHPFRWTFTGYPSQAGVAVDSSKAA